MWKNFLGCFVLCFSLVAMDFVNTAHGEIHDGQLNLTVRNGLISADVQRQPLVEVLSALAAQGLLRFEIKGIPNETIISTVFFHLPFDQALDRLLADFDYAMIRPSDKSPSRNGNLRLTPLELVVLQRASPSVSSKRMTFSQPAIVNGGKPVLKQELAQPAPLGSAWTAEQERKSEAIELQQALTQAIEESVSEDQEETRTLLSELNALIP